MSTVKNAAPGNIYVNLDQPLPIILRLGLGQNLIFIRDFSSAGGLFLRSLKMPAPYFVTADDPDPRVKIPGQPEGTYVVGLALVNLAGKGEILIRFSSSAGGPANVRRKLKFDIS